MPPHLMTALTKIVYELCSMRPVPPITTIFILFTPVVFVVHDLAFS